MSIWFTPITLEQLNQIQKNTVGEVLGIEFTAIGEDSLTARMPVDHRTHQPAGLLHGGTSVVLAETLGSVASYLTIDPQQFQCVGLEVNANHLRSVRHGWVEGTCKPVHRGRTTHVWDIRIQDHEGRDICISRLTVAVVPVERI